MSLDPNDRELRCTRDSPKQGHRRSDVVEERDAGGRSWARDGPADRATQFPQWRCHCRRLDRERDAARHDDGSSCGRTGSAGSARLLRKLGVAPVRLDATCAKEDVYGSIGLRRGIFFDRETFGSDKLVVGVDAKPWAELLADAPLTPTARADIARLYEAKIDYMH